MADIKILRSRLGIIVTFLVILTVFSSASAFLVSKNKKNLTHLYNEEVKLFAKLSTRAIVQSYELYFDSGFLKFEETTNEILDQNKSIKKVEIIDTEGKVLYSSDKKTDGTTLPAKDMDTIRSLSPSYVLSSTNRIETIISPYVEDWGAHKYSARYFISEDVLDKELRLYRNEVFLSSALLFFASVFPLVFINHLKDIQVRKTDSERLQKLNKQKDDFMTLVAHNLRTPISIMKGYTNLAEEQTLKGIEKEYIEAIKDGADRLNEATETILSVTSLLSGESIRKEKVNITKITEETLNSSSVKIKEKKLKIDFNKENVVEATGSMKYLRKAIECYVDNAIKFNRERGSIEIIIQKSNKSINFKVKDTGIGIKEEDIAEIFSSFHRSVENTLDYDYAGLGMGLYLTKTIIEAHKGTVWVESEYGKGSTFGFRLPVNG